MKLGCEPGHKEVSYLTGRSFHAGEAAHVRVLASGHAAGRSGGDPWSRTRFQTAIDADERHLRGDPWSRTRFQTAIDADERHLPVWLAWPCAQQLSPYRHREALDRAGKSHAALAGSPPDSPGAVSRSAARRRPPGSGR